MISRAVGLPSMSIITSVDEIGDTFVSHLNWSIDLQDCGPQRLE